MINLTQDYTQLTWNEAVEHTARTLIRLAWQEDLQGQTDWSTWSTVPSDLNATARIVSREAGVICGLKLLPMIQAEMAESSDPSTTPAGEEGSTRGRWRLTASDGDRVAPGSVVARWEGAAADLLTMERIALNFLGRLSGIATQTRHFVDAVTGTGAAIYDTRKTTPGWRLLEKYAVRCGGGRNHRLALSSAVMLKDNHLASRDGGPTAPADRLRQIIGDARRKLQAARVEGTLNQELIFEVEVDSLSQLAIVLKEDVDLILLDNMTLHDLRQAVTMRVSSGRNLPLEASGGISLANVAQVASTGVDRISVGSLTHSVTALDLGLDWG